MPRIQETTVYQFDELSDQAKKKAREWFRQASAGDNYFAEGVIDSAAEAADMLGINLRTRTARLMGGGTRQEPQIYWSGFWSQGDGACFEGSYSYAKGAAEKIRKEWPQDKDLHAIAEGLQAVQKRYWYRLGASVRHTGRYSHEHSVSIDVEYTGDDYRKIDPADEETIADLLRDFMRWIYKALEKEYEYQNSAEVVDETIRANEYEFDEDGGIA